MEDGEWNTYKEGEEERFTYKEVSERTQARQTGPGRLVAGI